MKKIIFALIIFFSHNLVSAGSFTPIVKTDRFTEQKSVRYKLEFENRQVNGLDAACDAHCYMIISDNFIYLNGYSLLAVEQKIVKSTKVRLRIGENIYSGTCEYSKNGYGCYVSLYKWYFFEYPSKVIVKQILSHKGYFAIELKQDFAVKDVPNKTDIWYTTLQ